MTHVRTAASLLAVGAISGIGVCFVVGWKLAERLVPRA
jgi:hypothetical protein